ncbi:MAG: adenylate/guanylate cyclase domain-containing protein [Chloroflexi bacterium]|nr:adenylate/guanylate cyclase domain-containing protein [Chloroflexota bacterium]
MQAPRGFRLDLRRVLLLGIVLILLVLEVLSAIPGVMAPLERVELATRDGMMRLRGVRTPDPEIVIVAIDDFSFNWTGYQWPWPRAYLAQLVEKLNESGARLVGMDVFLFESGYDAGGDEALAAALEQTPQSVAVMQIFEDEAQGMVTLKLPLPVYRAGLDGIGLTGVNLDDDAIERGLQAFDTFGDDVYYHWAFETAALVMGVERPAITSARLVFNGHVVPVTQGRFLVDFAGPSGTYPTYPASDVADGLVDPAVFRGKIDLVGATSITLHDVYPTPLSASEPMPGVEIVANAIATILSGAYLFETPPWANLLIIILMALLAGFIGNIHRPTATLLALLGAMAAYLAVCYIFFVYARWYLPVAGPEAMLFLGVVVPFIEQAVSQEVEKRRVRGLFTRFLSPQMVDQLLATQDINSLNKRADVSILFSDIRGFTTLSEKMTPEEVVSLLNPYLEAMTSIVHKHGGTVDKYEGDAVIAFFGEPVHYVDHALRAVRAAVEMRVELARLNQRWQAEGRLRDGLEIGIGVHTGEVFVGLLGSAQRINYTVIGDNANLASRLQDQTKIVGWPILVSERTAELVKDEFEVEFAALQAIRGKSDPVNIYKVMGRKGASEAERVKALETQSV